MESCPTLLAFRSSVGSPVVVGFSLRTLLPDVTNMSAGALKTIPKGLEVSILTPYMRQSTHRPVESDGERKFESSLVEWGDRTMDCWRWRWVDLSLVGGKVNVWYT